MLEDRRSETRIVPALLPLNIQAAYTPGHRRELAAGQRQVRNGRNLSRLRGALCEALPSRIRLLL